MEASAIMDPAPIASVSSAANRIDPFAAMPDDDGSGNKAPPPVAAGTGGPAGMLTIHAAPHRVDPFASMKDDDGSKPAGHEATAMSLVNNAASGANEAIAGTLGAPVDVANWALGHIFQNPLDFTPAKPLVKNPVLGSQTFKDMMGKAGPDYTVPQNAAERIARGVGAGAMGMVLPGGAVTQAERAGALTGDALATAKSALGTGSGMDAAIGGASGATGQAAAEVVPDKYKPIAGLIGGLAGGLAVAAPAAIGETAVRGGVSFVAPAFEKGAQRVVGREMAKSIDVGAAKANLEGGAKEIVPGSIPTAAEQAPELLKWQYGVQNSGENGAAFAARAAEQNKARQESLGSLQPTGNAADLPAAIQSQRDAAAADAARQTDAVDTATAGRVAQAEAGHQASLADIRALAPDASPADVASHFRAVRDTMEAEHAAQVSAAQERAQAASAASAPVATSPEQVGANIRAPAVEAEAGASGAVKKLYAALPPDMVAPTAPVATVAKNVKASMLPENSPMEGEEARLFSLAAKYGDAEPLKNLNALRSSVLSEKANLRQSNPQAFGRLSQLQSAIETSVDHAVENRAALDDIAVRRGAMAPGDALPARVNRALDDTVQQRQATALAGDSGLPGASAGRSAGSDAGQLASGGQANVGPGNASGGERLPPAPGANASGPGTASPLRAANAAYRDVKQTYHEGPVGDILAKTGRGEWDLSNAELTKKVFHPGPTGGEDVRAYVKAVGPEKANTALAEAAAYSLHEAATRDGITDPKKVADWLQKHGPAIAELPPEVRTKFESAASAQEAVTEAMARQRDRMIEFDRSEAGKLMGVKDPGDVVREVGAIIGSKNGAQRLGELADAAKGNPAAEAGLHSAVVQHVLDRFLPEGGDPNLGKLQGFLHDKADVLGKVLKPEDTAALRQRAESAQGAGAAVKQAQSAREQAVAEAATGAKAKLDQYDKTVLGKIMGAEGKSNVLDKLGTIFGSSDNVKQMALLAGEAAKVPGGTDALRRAVQEMIQRDFSATAEAGSTGTKELSRAQLDRFMKENTEALEKVMTPEQVGKLHALVEDGLRSNRTITAIKLKGGSDTNQKLKAAAKSAPSVMGRLAIEGAAAGAGAAIGGPVGAGIGWLGAKAVEALHTAGLNNLERIRLRAAMDPAFARALLDKVPQSPGRNAAALIALRARQMTMGAALAAARQEK